jgi:poly(beta-D-mannuronate) lyase
MIRLQTARNSFTRPLCRFLLLGLLVIGSLAQAGSPAQAAMLESPWDAKVEPHAAKADTCPAPAKVAPDLSARKYYSRNGVTIDPAKKSEYLDATNDARSAAGHIVDHADAYRQEGDPVDAQCTAGLILDLARRNALGGAMQGNQANVFRAWMLNAMATSWLKVRQDSGLDAQAQKQIQDWLVELATKTIAFHKTYRPEMKAQNLRYWAGLAVMNTGIAADRQDFFEWGLAWGRAGANAVLPDGTLQEEVRRKDRARKYHLFALQPLVAIAEIAWQNGIDLYSLNDRGIQRLARMTLQSLTNPTLLKSRSGRSQARQTVQGTNLEWLGPLAKRFPDAYYDDFLKKYPAHSEIYLGGKLLYPAR